MSKLLLIDGNSILNRGFYGLPDLTNSEGLHTNAILGFLNIVQKVIEEEKPSNICVAFDLKKPTFRHIMYPEYKGTRKGMPDELREQFPVMKDVLRAMNICIIEMEGYEADDILGTMSRRGEAAGFEVTVLSGDRDLLQLATDSILVRIPKTKAGKTTVENYYAANVEEAYGVDPITFIELKALMGDTSDNIPGVPGVGEKTAVKLLKEYGSLDAIYDGLADMKTSKLKSNLEENKELAYLSKTLATIKLDVPIELDMKDTGYEHPYNYNTYMLFKKLGFRSLMGRFTEEDKRAPQASYMETEAVNTDVSDDVKNTDYLDEMEEIADIERLNIIEITEKAEFDRLMEDIENDEQIGFDILSSDGECYMLSIAVSKDKVYNIVFGGMLDVAYVIEGLLGYKGVLVCPNVKSCLKQLSLSEDKLETAKSRIMDAEIAAYLLAPSEGSYDYDYLAGKYLNMVLPSHKELVGKKELGMFSYADEDICRYIAYRAYIPYLIWKKLNTLLEATGMWELYNNIELPCLYSLYTMEKNGIKVDIEGLKEYGVKLKDRISVLTGEIYGYAGHEFNINSTKQLGVVLFEELGLKHGKKTKTGYSTGVEVLEKLSDEHPIIPAILEYRQLAKLSSTYVDGLGACVASDGRIHGTFNQTVTATGRISSTEPNLQNIPTRYPLGREIRRVIVPKDGCVFIDADYSQIELRVLAHLSKDKTLINAYNQDTDIHSITASEVFDVPIEDVDSLMRRKAKAVNFGIVYGISSFGLGQDLDISRKEAEGYIEKYFNTYKDVKVYLDDTVKQAKEKGYSVTMYGRRRPITELKASNYMVRSFGERIAMNSPIQGTAADIIKLAMIHVDEELKKGGYKSRLVLQVHDELIIEACIDEVEAVKKLLVDEMSHAAELSVPLIVDVHTGSNWLEAK